jgi:hypothetical protein
MYHFRSSQRQPSPMWNVASGTEMFVADNEVLSSLASVAAFEPHDAEIDGVVVATRHPTGWFVHAVRRDDLPEAQIGPFRELVTVRTYLLLAHGPMAPAWRPTGAFAEWRSVCLSPSRELLKLDEAFVD